MVIRDFVTVGMAFSINILLKLIVTSETVRPRSGPGRGEGPAVRRGACHILGIVSLDAYFTVDGKYVADEDKPIQQVAQQNSCLAVCPRLRGGAPGDGTEGQGGGQPSQLPITLSPPAQPRLSEAFPAFVFDDPVGARTGGQLNTFADVVRQYFDRLTGELANFGRMGASLEASLRGDTDTLRQQATATMSNLQEQAGLVLGHMAQDQADGRQRLEAVVASAGAKFAEVDALVSGARSGLESAVAFTTQLAPQNVQLQQQHLCGQQAGSEHRARLAGRECTLESLMDKRKRRELAQQAARSQRSAGRPPQRAPQRCCLRSRHSACSH